MTDLIEEWLVGSSGILQMPVTRRRGVNLSPGGMSARGAGSVCRGHETYEDYGKMCIR